MTYPKIYILSQYSTVLDPQAGKYASNHSHQHPHGLNHDSIKHFTISCQLLQRWAACWNCIWCTRTSDWGSPLIVFSFLSVKVFNGVRYIEEKTAALSLWTQLWNVWLKVEASICLLRQVNCLYICSRIRRKLYFKVRDVHLYSSETWLETLWTQCSITPSHTSQPELPHFPINLFLSLVFPQAFLNVAF